MADWRTKEDLKAEIAFLEEKYIDDMVEILTGLAMKPSEGISDAHKLGWYKTQVEMAQERVEKFIELARSTETHGESDAEELFRELKEA